MKEEILTDSLLRQYLLGRVSDEERERIETLLITDSHAHDRVLAARQDLIEDYLEDNLTDEEKANFLLHYAQTPEQQRKLRIDKSIKDWAVAEAKTAPVEPAIWSRVLDALRFRPAVLVPISIVCLIAILLGFFWVKNTMGRRALQREVAQLNTPESLSHSPPNMISLRLTPVTVRNGQNQNQITKQADTQSVELRLLRTEGETYQLYRATVRRVGVNEAITTFDVKGDSDSIRLRLPARILENGSYRIELSGIGADGSTVPTAEYVFTVTPGL